MPRGAMLQGELPEGGKPLEEPPLEERALGKRALEKMALWGRMRRRAEVLTLPWTLIPIRDRELSIANTAVQNSGSNFSSLSKFDSSKKLVSKYSGIVFLVAVKSHKVCASGLTKTQQEKSRLISRVVTAERRKTYDTNFPTMARVTL